jgi:glycosyltransferase involved in cell wall biosynthesis
VFEYLAAGRPILAVVPPDGAAAELIRAAGAGLVVAPEDVDGIAAALNELHTAWRAGTLDGVPLSDEWRRKVSRRTRSEELARVLEQVVG